jgi:ubiquinone/menaquinone biosynthesis C-methylase UbiE
MTTTTSKIQPKKPYKGAPMEGFMASWYAKITKSDRHHQRAVDVASRVPAGGSILEVAPGPGYFAIELAKLGNYRVCGLDVSKSFVRIASENARAAGVKVEFKQGDAAHLPYPERSFDFVACTAAFKNFSDPQGALAEIYRVLKPGGRASIVDLRKDADREEIRQMIDEMHLSAVSALWTRLTFRFFLLKNAYEKQAIEKLAADSPFRGCELANEGVQFDLRLAKN